MGRSMSSGARRAFGRWIVPGFVAAAVAGLAIVGAAGGSTSRVATAPANSSLPTIGGTASTGSTVTANPGTWTGSAPITFQYQWQICGTNGSNCHDIGGATAQTYAIQTGDVGNTLRVHVIAGNSDGSSSATSNPSALIAAGATGPVNSSVPTISGTTTVGSTLTANAGTWTGANPITFKYFWEICGADGNNCHDISGATNQTYQLGPNDPGNTVRVRVGASNSDGSGSATSAPTAQIAAPAPPPTGCPALASGATSVPVANVTAPALLQITQFTPSPTVITGHTGPLSVTFKVTDTCGQAVQGANVYATAVPYAQFTVPGQQPTDANGNVTLDFHRLNGFPASRNQKLLVMFVRATKPGESVLAGISTRRLISFHVNLHA